jgi:uncharacterized RDD family membrane protein YckC
MATPVSWREQPTETTTGPAPGVDWASPGSRLVGFVIDGVVQFGLSIALFVVAAVLTAIILPLGLLAAVAGAVFLFIYFPYFWQRSGQTPGMRLMQIKVVRDRDGGPVTWGSAILRLVGYWVSGVLLWIPYLWIFVDKRRRGLHDLLGGTVVISAPSDLTSA